MQRERKFNTSKFIFIVILYFLNFYYKTCSSYVIRNKKHPISIFKFSHHCLILLLKNPSPRLPCHFLYSDVTKEVCRKKKKKSPMIGLSQALLSKSDCKLGLATFKRINFPITPVTPICMHTIGMLISNHSPLIH